MTSARKSSGSYTSNAPDDAGFCYFCGKALPFPLALGPDQRNLLVSCWKMTQDYIWELIGRLNGHLERSGIPCTLDFGRIRRDYAKKNVNERHVARALYDELARAYPAPADFEAALVPPPGRHFRDHEGA